MAGYDIGPRIGIKGESEFNAQIKKINNSLKEYGSEMKALTAEFESNENSQQALISKNKVLQKQLEAQGQKMSTLQSQYDKEVAKLRELANAYQKISTEMGENSTEASKAESAYNKQAESVSKLKVAMNETQGYINKLNNTIDKNGQMLDEMENGLRDTSGELTELGKAAEKADKSLDGLNDHSNKLTKFGEVASSASEKTQGLSTAAGGLLAAIAATVPATSELRSDLSKLDNNAKSAGVGIDETREAFEQFNAVSDEVDSSVEATSNLLQAGFTESNLQKAVEGLSGAYLKFPDTMKIESLADSLQETLATGQATGQFGELLDRLGVGADNFSKGLQECSTEAERQNYVLQTLADAGLMDVYDGWVKNNKELVESKQATLRFQEAMADLADTITPLITAITGFATEALTAFNGLPSSVQNIIIAIIGMIAALSPVLGFVGKLSTFLGTGGLSGALTMVKGGLTAVSTALAGLSGPVLIVIAAIASLVAIFVTLWNTNEGFREAVGEIWTQIQSAIQTALSIIQQIIQAFVQLVSVIWQQWGDTIMTVVSNTVSMITTIINEGLNIIQNVIKLFTAILEGDWEGAWDAVKNILSSVLNILKTLVSTAFNNMVTIISSVGSKIGSAVKSAFQSAISFITSLPSKAVGWGRDFINGLKNGIMSGVNAIVNAVRNVAKRIRSFLHFSRPDEGPLRDYETWMPDMLTGMADSVYKNLDIIQDAAKTISGTINSNITDDRNGVMRSAQTSYSSNIVIEGDSIILEGKVIGKTAERYITNGQVARMKARGAFA